MSDLIKPPILDDTGQTIKTKLTAILQALQNAGNVFIPKTQKGAASGVAELDSNGKVPSNQLDLTGYMQKGVDYVTAGKKASTVLGTKATAEGEDTTANGYASHAEGNTTKATNNYAHAEGEETTASGGWAHAEGNNTTASGTGAHAEGRWSTASGYASHAEGYLTSAVGTDSHAEGIYTAANANYSHAEGGYTVASSVFQHVEGQYNVEDDDDEYAHIVGNGTSDNDRSNAFAVSWAGDTYAGRSNGIDTSTAKSQKKLPTSKDVEDFYKDKQPVMSQDDYDALELAGEVDPDATYYLPDGDSLYPPVQDDATATDLTNGDLPTGQTIESWLNNKIQDNSSATDLEDTKIPTGRTIESYLNSKIVKYVDTSVTGAINTLDNGLYILETGFPSLPTGAIYLHTLTNSATVWATENYSTNKLYLCCAASKASATYNLRVFYYVP